MMSRSNRPVVLIFVLLLTLAAGCREKPVPKPEGYFRIDLPEKEYRIFNDGMAGTTRLPFSFEYPVYGNLVTTTDNPEPGWFNIEFPHYNARIYLTYKQIKNDFNELMEQTYTMNVKNHITKADAIEEKTFSNNDKNVYGILYNLKGNTATAVQFYVTDSVKNYLRGSLYFAAEPDADSLAPLITFFREDIIHLIETLEWK